MKLIKLVSKLEMKMTLLDELIYGQILKTKNQPKSN